MADITCDSGSFYDTLMSMVYEVVADNEAALAADVYAMADECAEDLRHQTGPWSQTEDDPETGRPAYFFEKGWKSYHHKPTEGHVDAVVANANAPSLTHLVEKPHRLFLFGQDTGRMTKAHPIVKEAYEKAAASFEGRARVT